MTKHKTDDFVAIVASIVDSKLNQLIFFFCRVQQFGCHYNAFTCLITADVVIFVPTTTTATELLTNHFTPCTCVQGKKLKTVSCLGQQCVCHVVLKLELVSYDILENYSYIHLHSTLSTGRHNTCMTL